MTGVETAQQECEGCEGKYVPWSWGEVFACTTCGERVRQSHLIQPVTPGRPDYDSIYPIPAHNRSAA